MVCTLQVKTRCVDSRSTCCRSPAELQGPQCVKVHAFQTSVYSMVRKSTGERKFFVQVPGCGPTKECREGHLGLPPLIGLVARGWVLHRLFYVCLDGAQCRVAERGKQRDVAMAWGVLECCSGGWKRQAGRSAGAWVGFPLSTGSRRQLWETGRAGLSNPHRAAACLSFAFGLLIPPSSSF